MLTKSRPLPQSLRRTALMTTCLCDVFYDDVARATVEVLEHLGCELYAPDGQTCCGQPAFNAGDFNSARRVVRHLLKVFAGEDPVVVPSGSCAAMLFHSAPILFENQPELPAVRRLASRVWELADFIRNALGVKTWPGRFNARLAFHRSCHTRETPSYPAAVELVGSIEGVELVPFGESEQCCGFGGTFSVTFPHISGRMGRLKLENILTAKPDQLLALDMGCLIHLKGICEKEKIGLPVIHFAQVLRDALKNRRSA